MLLRLDVLLGSSHIWPLSGWVHISGTSTMTMLMPVHWRLYVTSDVREFECALTITQLCTSFAWCLFYTATPYLLKPRRAIHPGVAVGFDLLFCGGFITIGLFTLGGLMSTINFGSNSYLSDPGYHSNYSGNYYLAPNNTWVYNITYAGTGYYNSTLGRYVYIPGDIHNVTRSCTPRFTTCVEQDVAVNRVWHAKPRIEYSAIVMNTVIWLDALLHLVLFVWACVDTHKYNSTKKKKTQEQAIESRIMADLDARGMLVNNTNHSDASKASPPSYAREV